MKPLLVVHLLVLLPAISICANPNIQRRNSVTDYAPQTNVQCPDLSTSSLIRLFTPQNQTLHPDEQRYVSTRSTTVIRTAWTDWLGDGSHLGYNLTAFSGAFPNVGIVIPGGGLRAAQYGASALLALDGRNQSSKAAGTGGLLQVASYIAGLSGSSRNSQTVFLRRAEFFIPC
jgi:lysophospholipase